MGVSRIYIGDHWPSDVLGGVILGSIFLVWIVLAYRWLEARFFAPASTPEKATKT
jgi:membrane-associated phospholipid phosphatase